LAAIETYSDFSVFIPIPRRRVNTVWKDEARDSSPSSFGTPAFGRLPGTRIRVRKSRP
jgi:hypothetical protein